MPLRRNRDAVAPEPPPRFGATVVRGKRDGLGRVSPGRPRMRRQTSGFGFDFHVSTRGKKCGESATGGMMKGVARTTPLRPSGCGRNPLRPVQRIHCRVGVGRAPRRILHFARFSIPSPFACLARCVRASFLGDVCRKKKGWYNAVSTKRG